VSERITARITVERVLTDDGHDLIRIDSDDMSGEPVPALEALGMLQMALYDVMTPEWEDDDEA
jgi:hypothetical protein